jgi:FKBP-type peptidyl-prolyl cis-trans isomerase FkpA
MTRAFLVRAAVVLGSLVALGACGSSSPVAPDQSNVEYSQNDLTVGTGPEAANGNTVNVTYAGWLYSDTATDHKGSQFDASTFSFVLGANTIIKGFEQGVVGMKVGGVRRLVIPPSLAYGANGNGTVIPPNAALVFDVQLNSVQ